MLETDNVVQKDSKQTLIWVTQRNTIKLSVGKMQINRILETFLKAKPGVVYRQLSEPQIFLLIFITLFFLYLLSSSRCLCLIR